MLLRFTAEKSPLVELCGLEFNDNHKLKADSKVFILSTEKYCLLLIVKTPPLMPGYQTAWLPFHITIEKSFSYCLMGDRHPENLSHTDISKEGFINFHTQINGKRHQSLILIT